MAAEVGDRRERVTEATLFLERERQRKNGRKTQGRAGRKLNQFFLCKWLCKSLYFLCVLLVFFTSNPSLFSPFLRSPPPSFCSPGQAAVIAEETQSLAAIISKISIKTAK